MAYKFLITILLMYTLIPGYIFIMGLKAEIVGFATEYNRREVVKLNRLAENILPEERGSVMIWGEGLHVSRWILTTGIFPRNRFFSNVKAFATVDPDVKREWLEIARNDSPRWIIYSAPVSEFTGDYLDEWTKHFRQNRDPDIENLLRESYELKEETEILQNVFRLYRLKESS